MQRKYCKLNNATFVVSGDVNGTLVSGENGEGYTNILDFSNVEPGKTYQVTITETKAPSDEYEEPSKLSDIKIKSGSLS